MSENELNEIKSGESFLQDLHRQFAENANSKQNLFLTLFGSLFVTFTAFGYVLIHTVNDKKEYVFQELPSKCTLESGSVYFSTDILFWVSFAVIAILSFLTIMLITFGWGFRREQVVNDAIRQCALKGVKGPEYSEMDAYTFVMVIHKYGLGENIKTIPDFYQNFAAFLTFIKVSITIFLYIKFSENDIEVTAIFGFVISTLFLECFVWKRKYLKTNNISSVFNIRKLCKKIILSINEFKESIKKVQRYESFWVRIEHAKECFETIRRFEAIEDDFSNSPKANDDNECSIFIALKILFIFLAPTMFLLCCLNCYYSKNDEESVKQFSRPVEHVIFNYASYYEGYKTPENLKFFLKELPFSCSTNLSRLN